MQSGNPIKTKDEFVQFAKAYNRFIIFFLINLFVGLPCTVFLAMTNYSEGDVPVELLSIFGLIMLILNIATIVLMFIAAKKSKSDSCFISCVLYFVLSILVVFIPQLGLLGLVMLFVMLTSFYNNLKKYNLKVSFLVTQKMIDSIWFCTCGNVCNEDFCPFCGQYWMNANNNNAVNNMYNNNNVYNNNTENNNVYNNAVNNSADSNADNKRVD